MTFFEAVAKCYRKYFVFKGRASRSEFWWWTLFTFIVSAALSSFSGLSSLASAALFLPSIAVGCRRMHDRGRRGWWQLLPIVSLVFACQQSAPEMNQYGPPPAPTSL
jgi:uncharacterized membrane protein YhaH (DUF805 family)